MHTWDFECTEDGNQSYIGSRRRKCVLVRIRVHSTCNIICAYVAAAADTTIARRRTRTPHALPAAAPSRNLLLMSAHQSFAAHSLRSSSSSSSDLDQEDENMSKPTGTGNGRHGMEDVRTCGRWCGSRNHDCMQSPVIVIPLKYVCINVLMSTAIK